MNILVKFATFCLLAAVALTHHKAEAAIDCAGLGVLEECMRPNDSVNATGQFICRRRYNPAIGRVDFQTLCIAKTWGTQFDVCGCCNNNCPSTCSELCANPNGVPGPPYGRFIYDWYSFTPYRMCVTPGRTLQLQQQNGDRWRCSQKNSWFFKTFYGDDPEWKEDGTATLFP